DDIGTDSEVFRRLDTYRGEGLVDLDQVQVVHGQAGLVQRVPDRPRGLAVQRVVRAGDVAVRADVREPRQAKLLRAAPAHHHARGRAIRNGRGGTGGERPVRAERRPKPGPAP